MNPQAPIIKHQPYDFLVVESLVLRRKSTNGSAARFQYFRLRKCGFTTFEAVKKLSEFFCIPPQQIQFAGLKDEDGVTEQTIAIAGQIDKHGPALFNTTYCESDFRFVELESYGEGDEPINIGHLNGNSFRIVLRRIDPNLVQLFSNNRKRHVCFINYYDTQRFGVPNGPKITHLIGESLLTGDYPRAVHYLKQSNSPESKIVEALDGLDPEQALARLDPRTIRFYKSSHASFEWNAKLRSLIRGQFAERLLDETFDGIGFTFLPRTKDIISLMESCDGLEFTKYDSGATTQSVRATVIQTVMHLNAAEPDEAHPGYDKVALSFFLPSGCYATMCVKQMVRCRNVELE